MAFRHARPILRRSPAGDFDGPEVHLQPALLAAALKAAPTIGRAADLCTVLLRPSPWLTRCGRWRWLPPPPPPR